MMKVSDEYLQASEMSKNLNDLFVIVDGFRVRYTETIKTGDLTAKYMLADYFIKGEYIEKDFKKAFQYYYSCAESGDWRSQFELAYCYEKGIGTDFDMIKANYWYEQAEKNHSSMKRKDFKSLIKNVKI